MISAIEFARKRGSKDRKKRKKRYGFTGERTPLYKMSNKEVGIVGGLAGTLAGGTAGLIGGAVLANKVLRRTGLNNIKTGNRFGDAAARYIVGRTVGGRITSGSALAGAALGGTVGSTLALRYKKERQNKRP